ncbi:ABC transporter permease subunit [Ignavibacterium sp.]|uniref:ABC transporter permease subunit n=1 Tax=Ignavibacterium sp. TaxID=2651167 RepID=UPI00307F5913
MNLKSFKTISIVAIIYLILFEFIFPTNKLFPSVTVIWLSIFELFVQYNFATSLLSTLAAVYLTFFIHYIFIITSFPFLVKYQPENCLITLKNNFFKFFFYIPFLLLALLIILWLPDFIFNKYLVSFFVILSICLNDLNLTNDKSLSDYFNFYNTLGIKKSTIVSKIIFNLKEPELFNSYLKNHTLIWAVILLVEFLQQKDGIGSILRIVFKYHDIALTFTIALITSSIIFLLHFGFRKLYNRIYFWN